MAESPRKSGIDIIGEVPWGTHFCQFYRKPQDLLDVLVPYFKAGLENNEFCIWITSEPLGTARARRAMQRNVPEFEKYLSRGQIEIIPYTDWYIQDGTFDEDRVLRDWADKVEQALTRGFSGLRLTGNTFWLEKKHWTSFTHYEASINEVIRNYRMLAICTYSLEKCNATEVIDIIQNHQFALIKREGKWDIIESVVSQQTKEALRQSEQRYHDLFNAMTGAFALHEIVVDRSGKACDYRFIEVNEAFSRHTGLSSEGIIGKTVKEILPEIEDFWIEIYGRVALTGEETSFESFAAPLDKWFEVYAYSPKEGFFATIFRDVTQRKKAEETLQETEKDLKRAQAVAQTGSWRLDVQRNILLWSDENHRIFGIPREKPMTYETFLASVHPDDREYVNARWNAALQGEDYDIEHRIIVGNEVKWIRERAELEFDEEGMLKGGFGTSQDITERVLAQEALKEASRQWQETFDAMPDLISIQSRDYTILKVNNAFAEAFGLTPEQLVGQKCYRVLHESDEPIAGCPHQQTIQSGRLTTEEIFEPTRDAYFDISTAPIVNSRGEITSSVHVARDVTGRKKTEERLAFQVRLLAAIEDPVLATDARRRIVFWGKGASHLLGWDAEEVMGRDVVEVLVPEKAITEAEEIDELMRKGHAWAGEMTIRCRDGSPVSVLIQSSPVLDNEGRFVGAIAAGKDISELKKVDKMKDEFIGLVSHELRTPLTVISGSLRSAMYPSISAEDKQELIQNAIDGAESLATILENMLELSRYQAGRLSLNTDQIIISDIAREVIERLRIQGARQQFTLDFPGDLPPVEADSMRVERILHNLLENATKYSPRESEITVSARRESDFVVTQVQDQGQGMSSEDQERLFQLFERTQSGNYQTSGLGLGLVVCKRLVEAQGDWIRVDSEPGKGAAFFFALPASLRR